MEFTPAATQHLLRLRDERGFDPHAGARFEANAQRVRLTFATEPASQDRILNGTELPIFVAPEVIDKLEHAVIDIDTSAGRTRLIIRRGRRVEASGPGARTT